MFGYFKTQNCFLFPSYCNSELNAVAHISGNMQILPSPTNCNPIAKCTLQERAVKHAVKIKFEKSFRKHRWRSVGRES